MQKSYAETYISVSGSLNSISNLEFKATSEQPLLKDFNITNNFAPVDEIVCVGCPYGSGTIIWDIHKKVSVSESLDYSHRDKNLNINSKLNKQGTPSYGLAVGYKIKYNFRIEGEFRYTTFSSSLSSLYTNLNVNHKTIIKNEFSCELPSGRPPDPQNQEDCSKLYSDTFNSTENINNNYNIYTNLLDGYGDYSINSTSNIMYVFINLLYDAPLSESFGAFAGMGIGEGYYKLSSTTNLPLSLNGTTTFLAYQYKIGAYYNILKSDNVRLFVSFTQINSQKIKFKDFSLAPLNSSSIDFGLMYSIR
jgi:hypothetical protein